MNETIAMPTDEEALRQMTSGLQYLHSKNFAHQNIKPSNVLVSSSATLKWSDYGLCKQVTNKEEIVSIPKTLFWTAPELIIKPTKDEKGNKMFERHVRSDIFSAGCVFFYFLSRGIHPFGTEADEVAAQIVLGDPINLGKCISI